MTWDKSNKTTWAWRKVRAQVLDRDGYMCMINHRCCTGEATEVHHIDGVHGNRHEALDPDRCVSACHACHLVETKAQAAYGRWGRRKRPVPRHPSEV